MGTQPEPGTGEAGNRKDSSCWVASRVFVLSYLRTMTALLDPAQMEERERRRIKQLELQVRGHSQGLLVENSLMDI